MRDQKSARTYFINYYIVQRTYNYIAAITILRCIYREKDNYCSRYTFWMFGRKIGSNVISYAVIRQMNIIYKYINE